MITKKTLTNGKVQVSSSYFDDMKTYKDSLFETNKSYHGMSKEYREQYLGQIQLSATAQIIALWRKGCRELSGYVSKLSEDQCKNIVTKYVGEDVKPLTDEEWEAYQRECREHAQD